MEIDQLQASGRKLYPFEIKAGRTYSSEFAKNIKSFRKLNDKISDSYVICSGEQKLKVEEVELLNFVSTAKKIH